MNAQPQHPSVSPIIIAETLLEQFGQINRSLGAGVESLGAEGAEVHMAEGNRVYPAIWEHLDQAHEALGTVDSKDDAYPRIRARANTLIGIFDFEHEGTKQTLTGAADMFAWRINEEGLRFANEACDHIKNLLPEVSWDEAHRAAEVDMVDLRSGENMLTLVKFGLVVLALVGVAVMFLL